jgi:hypothetical protein
MGKKNKPLTLEAQLVEWLRLADDPDCRPNHRRIWLKQGISRIYLRKAKRLIGTEFVNCLDIANCLAGRSTKREKVDSDRFVDLAIAACPWEAIVIDQSSKRKARSTL